MKLNAAELQLPGGKLYLDGDTCQGKAVARLVKEFAFAGDTTGTLQNVDPRNVPLPGPVAADHRLRARLARRTASRRPPPTSITNLNKLAATLVHVHDHRPGARPAPRRPRPRPPAAPTSTTVKK